MVNGRIVWEFFSKNDATIENDKASQSYEKLPTEYM